MPTSSTESNQPHRLRQVAESFGTDAERYDRTRPRYPDALVERIVAAGPGPLLLDVGSGTGIAARQFQAAGCQVLGVEPDPRMAALARQTGVETEVSTFEDWDPAGRTFDTVAAAQAWHWVDPVAGAAQAARVLRPGGRLALFWNAFQPPPDLAEAFTAIYRRVLPETPVHDPTKPLTEAYSAMCDTATDGMRQAGAFGEPERWHFDWEHTYTRDEWLDQTPTHGGNNRLPAAELDEVLSGMGAAIDAVGGAFRMHYTAVVVTAARTA
ncbi:class I SAM-dependent methyltransferase [Nonomuraea sp. KC401]|uniref:class I SAM-dependent methyltransferase n=1 Tax=unclassified Nonomuraea TaxID=2593643 RepID=UPI0010FEFE38|nr:MULTISPECIES: class I SAM-dependent methyltransferase [unclassified Nonomuraea]NBE97552.1 methyltransferase domain-containing protein [Nonomuraea sp. K271]TLF64131.1 class I SAM-dependent methyltransferase [Nonomuraea sp. KC401]